MSIFLRHLLLGVKLNDFLFSSSFLYTDKVTFGSENQAFQTYEAATKFLVEDLKLECEIYLSELDLRPQTVWKNLEKATSLKMGKMERKYMSYIEKNTFDCLHDSSFLTTSGEIVLKIMTSEKLAVAEFALLNRLVTWGKNKNKIALKQFLRPYLAHARFRALTPKEFCSFIQSHPDLIDSHESLQILQNLELPHKNALPAWCCRSPRRIWPY